MNTIRRNALLVLFVLLCGSSSICLIWLVSGSGDSLSWVDEGSEANVLREVRHFLEQGVTEHYGLGNLKYQGMYDKAGIVPYYLDKPESDRSETAYVREHVVHPDGVYTHYPPGPEYLVYAAARVLGLTPVWRLRLLPIAIGFAATLFLALAVRRRFGATAGWLVAAALVLTPSVTSAFVALHDQGFALALTMFEVGITLAYGRRLAPLALIGFVQGWLSFDQVFLVTFIPLAMELVLPAIEPGYQSRWTVGLWRSVMAGGGFAFAHGLHFLEVCAYFGSVQAAMADLGGAAAYRSGAAAAGGLGSHIRSALENVLLYFIGAHVLDFGAIIPEPGFDGRWPMYRFFGMGLGLWWVLVSVGLIVWSRLNPGPETETLRKHWHLVFGVGLLTSSLWLLVMVNHGGYHERFIYRHLFFAWFVSILFGAASFSRRRFAVLIPRARVVATYPIVNVGSSTADATAIASHASTRAEAV